MSLKFVLHLCHSYPFRAYKGILFTTLPAPFNPQEHSWGRMFLMWKMQVSFST